MVLKCLARLWRPRTRWPLAAAPAAGSPQAPRRAGRGLGAPLWPTAFSFLSWARPASQHQQQPGVILEGLGF